MVIFDRLSDELALILNVDTCSPCVVKGGRKAAVDAVVPHPPRIHMVMPQLPIRVGPALLAPDHQSAEHGATATMPRPRGTAAVWKENLSTGLLPNARSAIFLTQHLSPCVQPSLSK